MRKDKAIYVRVTETEREAIRREAKKQARNMSNFFLWLWREFRDKNK